MITSLKGGWQASEVGAPPTHCSSSLVGGSINLLKVYCGNPDVTSGSGVKDTYLPQDRVEHRGNAQLNVLPQFHLKWFHYLAYCHVLAALREV